RLDRSADGELDLLFETFVDGLRRDVRRLRTQVERFRRAYQKRSATDDETTRRAFRRLRQLQLIVDHIESSAAYLLGSGIAPERKGTDDERAALERRVLDSLEAERERLVREVHDGPAQVLANAIFELEYLERIAERTSADVRSALRTEIAALKGRFRASLDGVRATIYDLRPPVLSELGLTGAISTYANEYESRYGLKTLLQLDERDTGLDPQQELAVYRIMQEALQNTHKHAQATAVRIEWERDGASTWILRCTDDGIGFDLMRAARQARSVGLLSMRERAELIGAAFDVRSTPGQGTTVSVRLTAHEDKAQ
ncbi:MAG: sensor histidine kinase, partial [Chloroflexi bacterium]|nr:sensor histidine kinase [Chloroflexota bacterium]